MIVLMLSVQLEYGHKLRTHSRRSHTQIKVLQSFRFENEYEYEYGM